MKPILQPLPPVSRCNIRYAVLLEGEQIGIVSKDTDSWQTKFPWRAWTKGVASDDTNYVGEFSTWQDAAAAVQETHEGLIRRRRQNDLTKHQT